MPSRPWLVTRREPPLSPRRCFIYIYAPALAGMEDMTDLMRRSYRPRINSAQGRYRRRGPQVPAGPPGPDSRGRFCNRCFGGGSAQGLMSPRSPRTPRQTSIACLGRVWGGDI